MAQLPEDRLARLDPAERHALDRLLREEWYRLSLEAARIEGADQVDRMDVWSIVGAALAILGYLAGVADIHRLGETTALGWAGLAIALAGLVTLAMSDQIRWRDRQRRAADWARLEDGLEVLKRARARLAGLETSPRDRPPNPAGRT